MLVILTTGRGSSRVIHGYPQLHWKMEDNLGHMRFWVKNTKLKRKRASDCAMEALKSAHTHWADLKSLLAAGPHLVNTLHSATRENGGNWYVHSAVISVICMSLDKQNR